MKFSISAVLALAAAVVAQDPNFDPVYTPTSGEKVAAGSTFEITWSAPAQFANVPITIALIGGATQGTQVPISTIASESL